jgi:hypothetical protein
VTSGQGSGHRSACGRATILLTDRSRWNGAGSNMLDESVRAGGHCKVRSVTAHSRMKTDPLPPTLSCPTPDRLRRDPLR